MDNNILFKLIQQTISGDADNDGVVSVKDVVLMQRCLLSLETFSEAQIEACDINKDGKVSTVDVIMMMRKLVSSDTN